MAAPLTRIVCARWYPFGMPPKKKRKRAYIPPANEVTSRREGRETTRPHKTSAKQNARAARNQQQYEYPVPGVKRTARRLPIYFVMIFALQYWVVGTEQPELTSSQRLTQAAVVAAFITVLFAPFMHVMDKWAYNRYLRRTGQQATSKDS